ncbi:MAG: rhodanese-like domain-containing protein [Acidobacteria bacterium]|nr:rhodanese-like domain-containing protein [Acidobacteriota bacterium]
MKVWRVAVLVGLGSVLGLVWNAASGRGLALARNVFLKDGDDVVVVADARARLERGALFLDARPAAFYQMSHVPGALPLPEDDFEPHFARIESRLRSALDVIVYCSGYGCEASHDVARKLKERGIPAAILHEGWPGWQEAGYPEKVGDAP